MVAWPADGPDAESTAGTGTPRAGRPGTVGARELTLYLRSRLAPALLGSPASAASPARPGRRRANGGEALASVQTPANEADGGRDRRAGLRRLGGSGHAADRREQRPARRREPLTLHHQRRAAPGRRAGDARWTGRRWPPCLPAPAADRRRHDGQPRAAQGRLAAARRWPGSRCCASTPAGPPSRGRHQRGQLRRGRRASGSTWRRRVEYAESARAARPAGCSAGPSAPTSRCGTATSTRWSARGDPAVAAAAVRHRRRPRPLGGVGQARWSPWCPSSTTTCGRTRPRAGSPGPAGRGRRRSPGRKHLWVGEKYVRIALDEVVRHVAPASYPLPGEYAGPMERWSDL